VLLVLLFALVVVSSLSLDLKKHLSRFLIPLRFN
jgi:hypothetical protein